MVNKLPVKEEEPISPEFDLLGEVNKFETRVEVLLITAKRLRGLALPFPQTFSTEGVDEEQEFDEAPK